MISENLKIKIFGLCSRFELTNFLGCIPIERLPSVLPSNPLQNHALKLPTETCSSNTASDNHLQADSAAGMAHFGNMLNFSKLERSVH